VGRELRKEKTVKIFEEHLDRLSQNEDGLLIVPIAGEAPGANRDNTGTFPPEYEKLFEDLSKSENRIKVTNTAKVFKSLKGLKKIYFSGVWIPQDNSGSETHARQFLANYPEAGGIYSKMIHVHTLINNQLRGDKTRKRTALEELWKAQDSAIFRIGSPSTPGLIHSHVRKAAYRALLEAEKITREKGKFTPSLSVFDFDLDGQGEYIFQDDKLNCCVKASGASIFELDYLPAAWNYLDTMNSDILKPNNGERRCAFVDWLVPAGTVPADIGLEGTHGARFCGNEEYEVSETDRLRRRVTFRLPPKAGFPWAEIEIGKTWQLKKNSLALEYVLKNTETKNSAFIFCPSIDLSFPGTGEGFLRVFSQREASAEKEEIVFTDTLTLFNLRILELHDLKNETVITLESSRSFDARIFQIHSGFPGMEEYQSTCIMPLLPVSLDGGRSYRTGFSFRISS
jgi:hypothetical protein